MQVSWQGKHEAFRKDFQPDAAAGVAASGAAVAKPTWADRLEGS